MRCGPEGNLFCFQLLTGVEHHHAISSERKEQHLKKDYGSPTFFLHTKMYSEISSQHSKDPVCGRDASLRYPDGISSLILTN